MSNYTTISKKERDYSKLSAHVYEKIDHNLTKEEKIEKLNATCPEGYVVVDLIEEVLTVEVNVDFTSPAPFYSAKEIEFSPVEMGDMKYRVVVYKNKTAAQYAAVGRGTDNLETMATDWFSSAWGELSNCEWDFLDKVAEKIQGYPTIDMVGHSEYALVGLELAGKFGSEFYGFNVPPIQSILERFPEEILGNVNIIQSSKDPLNLFLPVVGLPNLDHKVYDREKLKKMNIKSIELNVGGFFAHHKIEAMAQALDQIYSTQAVTLALRTHFYFENFIGNDPYFSIDKNFDHYLQTYIKMNEPEIWDSFVDTFGVAVDNEAKLYEYLIKDFQKNEQVKEEDMCANILRETMHSYVKDNCLLFNTLTDTPFLDLDAGQKEQCVDIANHWNESHSFTEQLDFLEPSTIELVNERFNELSGLTTELYKNLKGVSINQIQLAKNIQQTQNITSVLFKEWTSKNKNVEGYESNEDIIELREKIDYLEKKRGESHPETIKAINTLSLAKTKEMAERINFDKKIKACDMAVNGTSMLLNFLGHPKLASQVQLVGGAGLKIANNIAGLMGAGMMAGVNPIAGMMNIAGAIGSIVSAFGSSGPSPHQAILEAITNLSKQIAELREEMHMRFDIIEDKLDGISRNLLIGFSQLHEQNKEILDRLKQVNKNLHDFRNETRSANTTLFSFIQTSEIRQRNTDISGRLLTIKHKVSTFKAYETISKENYEELVYPLMAHVLDTVSYDYFNGSDLLPSNRTDISKMVKLKGLEFGPEFYIDLLRKQRECINLNNPSKSLKTPEFFNREVFFDGLLNERENTDENMSLPNPAIYHWLIIQIQSAMSRFYSTFQSERPTDKTVDNLRQMYAEGEKISHFIASVFDDKASILLALEAYKVSIGSLMEAYTAHINEFENKYENDLNRELKARRVAQSELFKEEFLQQFELYDENFISVDLPFEWWQVYTVHNKNGSRLGGHMAGGRGEFRGDILRRNYKRDTIKKRKQQADKLSKWIKEWSVTRSFKLYEREDELDYPLTHFLIPEDTQLPILVMPKGFVLEELPRCYLEGEALGFGEVVCQYSIETAEMLSASTFHLTIYYQIEGGLEGRLSDRCILRQYSLPFDADSFKGSEGVWRFWMGGEYAERVIFTYYCTFDPCYDGSSNEVQIWYYRPNFKTHQGVVERLEGLPYSKLDEAQENVKAQIEEVLFRAIGKHRDKCFNELSQEVLQGATVPTQSTLSEAIEAFDIDGKYLHLLVSFALRDEMFKRSHSIINNFFNNPFMVVNADDIQRLLAQKGRIDLSIVSALKDTQNTIPYLLEELEEKLADPSLQPVERVYSDNPIFNELIFQPIPKDGHCLFHIIALYLGEDEQFLRRIVSAHLEANPEDFRDSVVGDFEGYVEGIRDGSLWGGPQEIEVIQRITERPIIILRPDANPNLPDNLEAYDYQENSPIFIYFDGVSHYDGFVLKDDADPASILDSILSAIKQDQSVVYGSKKTYLSTPSYAEHDKLMCGFAKFISYCEENHELFKTAWVKAFEALLQESLRRLDSNLVKLNRQRQPGYQAALQRMRYLPEHLQKDIDTLMGGVNLPQQQIQQELVSIQETFQNMNIVPQLSITDKGAFLDMYHDPSHEIVEGKLIPQHLKPASRLSLDSNQLLLMYNNQNLISFKPSNSELLTYLEDKQAEADKDEVDTLWQSEFTERDHANIKGLSYQPVPDDGSCFYHAVALYLGKDAFSLRQEVAHHISENVEEYELIIQGLFPERTLQSYLLALESGQEWGDNLEMSILMHMYQRPIVAISPAGQLCNLVDTEQYLSGEPIFLSYNQSKCHYDAFLLNGEQSAEVIFNTLLQKSNQSLFLGQTLQALNIGYQTHSNIEVKEEETIGENDPYIFTFTLNNDLPSEVLQAIMESRKDYYTHTAHKELEAIVQEFESIKVKFQENNSEDLMAQINELADLHQEKILESEKIEGSYIRFIDEKTLFGNYFKRKCPGQLSFMPSGSKLFYVIRHPNKTFDTYSLLSIYKYKYGTEVTSSPYSAIYLDPFENKAFYKELSGVLNKMNIAFHSYLAIEPIASGNSGIRCLSQMEWLLKCEEEDFTAEKLEKMLEDPLTENARLRDYERYRFAQWSTGKNKEGGVDEENSMPKRLQEFSTYMGTNLSSELLRCSLKPLAKEEPLQTPLIEPVSGVKGCLNFFENLTKLQGEPWVPHISRADLKTTETQSNNNVSHIEELEKEIESPDVEISDVYQILECLLDDQRLKEKVYLNHNLIASDVWFEKGFDFFNPEHGPFGEIFQCLIHPVLFLIPITQDHINYLVPLVIYHTTQIDPNGFDTQGIRISFYNPYPNIQNLLSERLKRLVQIMDYLGHPILDEDSQVNEPFIERHDDMPSDFLDPSNIMALENLLSLTKEALLNQPMKNSYLANELAEEREIKLLETKKNYDSLLKAYVSAKEAERDESIEKITELFIKTEFFNLEDVNEECPTTFDFNVNWPLCRKDGKTILTHDAYIEIKIPREKAHEVELMINKLSEYGLEHCYKDNIAVAKEAFKNLLSLCEESKLDSAYFDGIDNTLVINSVKAYFNVYFGMDIETIGEFEKYSYEELIKSQSSSDSSEEDGISQISL